MTSQKIGYGLIKDGKTVEKNSRTHSQLEWGKTVRKIPPFCCKYNSSEAEIIVIDNASGDILYYFKEYLP